LTNAVFTALAPHSVAAGSGSPPPIAVDVGQQRVLRVPEDARVQRRWTAASVDHHEQLVSRYSSVEAARAERKLLASTRATMQAGRKAQARERGRAERAICSRVNDVDGGRRRFLGVARAAATPRDHRSAPRSIEY
jgi:hypothetical protein